MQSDIFTPAWLDPHQPPDAQGRFSPDAPYYVATETRTGADGYFWDGLRRGQEAHPFAVLQITLRGAGVYEAGGVAEAIGPGRAFMAVVPGAHRYFLPADAAAPWEFLYLLIRHPYIVRRIAERQQATASAAVLDLDRDRGRFLARVAPLYRGDGDPFAREEALFALLTAYERHVCEAAAPPSTPTRDRLLADAGAFVREHLHSPSDVAHLAARAGMSRSRYSHYFKAETGDTPAAVMARVRLEEVARRLVQTDATLAHIAAATGFADANHLCKAFRRHFHLSPGTFRRQMR